MGKIEQDSLRSRIRGYEDANNTKLISGLPVVVRMDGKAFHTFTHGFKKPYDEIISKCMQAAMLKVCSEAQNCIMGYTQSDEITIVLCDYLYDKATPWFQNRTQKITSTTASTVTIEFYKQLIREITAYEIQLGNIRDERIEKRETPLTTDEEIAYLKNLYDAQDRTIRFDSRAFNVPINEIENVFIDRQIDAERNSIQMLAQSVLGKKNITGISNKQLQNIMFEERNVNWNDVQTKFKRGSCCIRIPTEVKPGVIRQRWTIDNEIPIFSKDRDYISNKFKALEEK